ncbi:MAG: ComEC/Rec2 family competence protein, partial [Anaerotignum sp.]|nr:ComEC/Rec2 family competence protein [Anaerotignum sp.]
MKRTAFWAALYIICGIYFRLGRSEMICLVFFAFSVVSAFWFVMKTKNKRYLLFLLFIVLGFVMAENSASRQTADMNLVGMAEGSGVIIDEGRTTAGNAKFRIECDLTDKQGNSLHDVDIYVIWSGEKVFEVGDRVHIEGEIRPFYTASVPGSYDEDLYLRTKGYDGKMYPESMTYQGEETSLLIKVAQARGKLHDTLDEILPATESGIMKAMLTGDKEDIPAESYDLYSKTGIVHILCISGLHMSILALYVSFLAEKVLKRSRRFSAGLTMAASLLFLLFIGFTPSAVRAVTMICVVMTARIIFRSHDRLNEISLAALLILCIEPLYLFHIGFQLSFITVLGLCIAAEQMEQKRNKDITWKEMITESLRFSLYASLCSFPMVAYYFYYISPVGILANLVVIPMSGILLGLGILCGVSG